LILKKCPTRCLRGLKNGLEIKGDKYGR